MKHFRLVGTVVVAVLGIAACGGSSTSSSSSSSSSSGGGSGGSVVATASTSLGTVLTDASSGKTLYYFTPEKGGSPVCATQSSCNSTWPPLTASSAPAAPSGVTGQFTLVAIPSGMEVAYNSWPLHTYAGDSGPAQTNGQGIGGQWFVATPALTSSAGGGAASPSASSGNGY